MHGTEIACVLYDEIHTIAVDTLCTGWTPAVKQGEATHYINYLLRYLYPWQKQHALLSYRIYRYRKIYLASFSHDIFEGDRHLLDY